MQYDSGCALIQYTIQIIKFSFVINVRCTGSFNTWYNIAIFAWRVGMEGWGGGGVGINDMLDGYGHLPL